MQRLYVGGLSHTVTQKDLKDRFGKFGDVEDVELRTRKDEDGVPYKTFGYININISDADLKKCLTVLNKSKWKGGTLQIETAKESFLHRLSQERQAAADQLLHQPAADDNKQKLLESLSKAGVENFTMKAAVPGTEIPGHKDWVVSKFGRVLPVLQIRSQKGSRARTLKYDPSKYCHNIRRLDRQEVDGSTPVAQLTWQVQGGDDDISKRRRGEFPAYKPPQRKKIRMDEVNSHNATGRSRSELPVNSVGETRHVTNGFQPRPAQRTWRRDSDVDSDEEIRRLVASQQNSHNALQQDDNLEVVGLDYLEKFGHKGEKDEEDYDSADTDEIFASRKPPQTQEKPPQIKEKPPQIKEKPLQTKEKPLQTKEKPPQTQEKPLQTQEKPPQTQEKPTQSTTGNGTDRKRKKKSKAEEEEDSSDDDEEHLASKLQRGNSSKQKPGKELLVVPVVKPRLPESDSDDDDDDDDDEEEGDNEDEEWESAALCSDSDYEAMFSNVTHLEISLADLQKLAEDAEQNSETTAPRILSGEREPDTRPAKKGTTPEEILAALLQDDSSDDERDKKKKKKRKGGATTTTLPAFKGTKELNEESEKEDKKQDQEEVKEEKTNSGAQMNLRGADDETNEEEEEEKDISDAKVSKTSEKDESDASSHSDDDDEEEEEEEEEGDEEETDKLNVEEVVNSITAPKVLKISSSKIPENAESGSSSSSDDEEEDDEDDEDEDEEEVVKNQSAPEVLKASPVNPEKAETDSSSSSDDEDDDEEEEDRLPVRAVLPAEEEEERQRKANLRRLAAVQQRQKEAEEHKKLIQGALSKLDAPAAAAGKHIVFGSDDDDDDDDEDKPPTIPNGQSEAKDAGEQPAAANQEEAKRSGPRLFDGSEDEEEEEEEDHRFDIRPQFEGRAGQKLMELQSRFGTDERFKMDSRFLEEEEDKDEESETKKSPEEEDEALEEERKRNLSILNSVLGSSEQTSSTKTAGKAKKFRDVSALHYDPSREEHAAFETKTDETKKESKAARRKKKEEAQQLPEVSKEIYYDVSGDLKAVFGQTKDGDAEGEETTNWDQVEEEEQKEEETIISADPDTEKEDSSGFKFSFFGDDTETTTTETAEYKVEMIQAPKVSWQQDPRFNDSSSEEDEDEQEEEEEEEEDHSSSITKTTEDETPSNMNLFFFHLSDSRLTEGPRLFCRTSQLEDQREQWEERRTELRQEYRKKHKDARRKLASSLKS